MPLVYAVLGEERERQTLISEADAARMRGAFGGLNRERPSEKVLMIIDGSYRQLLSAVILFGLMGLWRAINWHWFLYGLMHGLAFCTFLWWRTHRNQPLIKKITLPSGLADIMSRIATYVFIGGATIAPSKLIQLVSHRRI
jgi:D-alanyl-lipoteichoic acid acyltransferase DltB (MBOAT superfamily)